MHNERAHAPAGNFLSTALAMAFALASALVLAFVMLKLIVGLVTREQYNVSDAPRRVRAIVWVDGAGKTQAQSLTEAAAPLAGRISSLLPRRATVSLEFQVLTPLAMAASSRFLSTLQDELRKTGLDATASAQAESRLRVVVSENPRGVLFVAEVTGADISGKATRQVVMLPWSGRFSTTRSRRASGGEGCVGTSRTRAGSVAAGFGFATAGAEPGASDAFYGANGSGDADRAGLSVAGAPSAARSTGQSGVCLGNSARVPAGHHMQWSNFAAIRARMRGCERTVAFESAQCGTGGSLDP